MKRAAEPGYLTSATGPVTLAAGCCGIAGAAPITHLPFDAGKSGRLRARLILVHLQMNVHPGLH
jgi:hypothetical protein